MPVSLPDIRAAATRIAPHVHHTPVMTCASLDAWLGARAFMKCEHLQRTGSFKYRGATNAVRALGDEEAARGVAAHSSGNHAAALACAARVRGIPAYVVVPDGAPAVKRAAVARYGARITTCENTLAAREAALAGVVAATGAVEIHPYDDDRVVAGAGTAALELCEAVPGLDAVVAPVGGGGLLSGTSVAVHGLHPEVRVIGAEPARADDAARSLAAGVLQPPGPPATVADGLRTGLSERTFAILREHVERIVTVTEDEIAEAMRTVWERTKQVIEPSAAVAFAAVRRAGLGGARVGIVVSGGNVDLGAAASLLAG
ncbi:MAG: serine/threonine dehydratase [Acidimicrobiia bacterium]|nr:MAG: serine/threonine dehydratase [Acidimicrobiia bacterium]